MPAISKLRLTNIVYEGGQKRYNDELFVMDGNNTAILLENGGGKTVLVQMMLQAVLPGHAHADRKIRETLMLDTNPAHIAVEWILDDHPRRYLMTAVTLFTRNNKLESYKYIYEYGYKENHCIEGIPFTLKVEDGIHRPASKDEMNEYYLRMKNEKLTARTFERLYEYHDTLEREYGITHKEWLNISKINKLEGGVEDFFDQCSTTSQLVNNLLIPTVEDALDQGSQNLFVESFERHRGHLKDYKELKRTIAQNKAIQDHVQTYVDVYKDYHQQQEVYNEQKGVLKGLYGYLGEELERSHQEDQALRLESESLEEAAKAIQNLKGSLAIAKLEAEIHELEQIYQQIEAQSNQAEIRLNTEKSRLEALDYLFKKEYIEELTEKLNGVQLKLNGFENNLDYQELAKTFEATKKALKSAYESQLHTYEKNIQASQKEGIQIQGQLDRTKEERKQTEGLKAAIQETYNKQIAQQQEKENAIEERVQKLIYLDPNESCAHYQKRLKDQMIKLQATEVELLKQLDEKQRKQQEIQGGLEQTQTEVGQDEKAFTELESYFKHFEAEEKNIKSDFINLTGRNLLNEPIYAQIESMMGTLKDTLNFHQSRADELKVNLSKKQYEFELYKDSELYAVDPKWLKKMKEWEQHYHVIHTGAEYLYTFINDEERIQRLMACYPYWGLTAIVLEKYKDEIREKTERYQKDLSCPLIILSDQDVMHMLEDEAWSFDQQMILPEQWQKNVQSATFKVWQAELVELVEQLQAEETQTTHQIRQYHHLLRDLERHLEKYPYDEYSNKREQQAILERKLAQDKQNISRYKRQLQTLADELSRDRKHKEEIKQELLQKENWYQETVAVIKLEKAIEELKKSIYEFEKQIQVKNKELTTLERLIEVLTQEKEIQKELERDYKNHLHQLKDERLYLIVETMDSETTDESLATLKVRYRENEELMEKKDHDYQQLMKEKEDLEISLQKQKEQLSGLAETLQDEPDRLAYPADLEAEIHKSKKNVKQQEAVYNALDKKREAAHIDYENANTRKVTIKTNHLEMFDSVLPIEKTFDEIEKEIVDLAKKQQYSQQENQAALGKWQKKHTHLQETEELLKIENGKYDFLGAGCRGIEVTEEILRDYPYNRVRYVENLIGKLKKEHSIMLEKEKGKETYKYTFKTFCQSEIRDVKLRNQTVSVLDHRDDYHSIFEWYQEMKAKIERIISMTESSLKEQDKEITKFIQLLYGYLKTVVTELGTIERKTKVKLGDQTKEIYKIKIPVWEEHTAKSEIRNYLIWMMEKLQTADYKDDYGNEKTQKMKSDIQNWLTTSKLLQKIFMDEPIRIKCRKVTNDGLISSSPSDWETTNKWSGGEKWSKNMTLFLGLLNYLAEKKHVQIGKNQKGRTVILDNPFGKASSGHVLKPVFLIAEQLGFQLIALTAHAEGKFISDYFPVVYSCKLRQSIDPRIQVMSKESEINYAYLADHNPISIRRLENAEYEQMSLFGME